MRIHITGYITEARGKDSFMIKVTSDEVSQLSFRNIQVSKEVEVFINKYHYPADYENIFERVENSKFRRRAIAESRSLSDALRVGDRVECSVFVVESETRNGVETHSINSNRRDIEAYADFPLWLYPNETFFKRLDVDTPETLKARKQWYYTCMNREKYKKITGYTLYGYRDKKWVNKNPKITFPILWWLQVKTTISNLWKRFTRQENLPKASLIANIILTFITTINIAIAIWSLFLKSSNPNP